jgi:DNA-binding SARP family transcriptional activator
VPLDGLRPRVDDLWIDVEAAAAALHRAESALALGEPGEAWGPSQVAMFVCGRPFLPGDERPWIDEERRRLGGLRLRALEAYAAATLGVGGTELAAAVRVGRALVHLEPYRESGYRILMDALDREGNSAEALLVYEALREKLREELGITPSEPTQALHRRLLR